MDEAMSRECGVWLLGEDKSLTGMPGYTTKLRYKSLQTNSSVYSGLGHMVQGGSYGGRQEFSMVMRNCIRCLCSGRVHALWYPQSIEIPDHHERTWRLADSSKPARILSIWRFLERGVPLQAGSGEGYEFHVIEGSPETHLLGPDSLTDWGWQLIEVFRGKLQFIDPTSDHRAVETLASGDYMYLPRVISRHWRSVGGNEPLLATTVYY